jgi:hypothetical protein
MWEPVAAAQGHEQQPRSLKKSGLAWREWWTRLPLASAQRFNIIAQSNSEAKFRDG